MIICCMDPVAWKVGHGCLVSCQFVIKHAGPAFVSLACTLITGITLACFIYGLPYVSVSLFQSHLYWALQNRHACDRSLFRRAAGPTSYYSSALASSSWPTCCLTTSAAAKQTLAAQKCWPQAL